jgi:hypothetical protein
MKTKVRVDRRKLSDVVKGRLRKEEAVHKRTREAHPAKLAAWNESQAKRLDRMAAKARNGGLTSSDHHFRIEGAPMQPSEGRDLCNLRRMLKTLEIGAEETILLSQEDADWYFGPCSS